MRLYSTNRRSPEVSLKEAVFKGLPSDNGLFMPVSIPVLEESFSQSMDKLNFQEIAFKVSQALIGDDVPDQALKKIISETLTFDAPLVEVEKNIFALELFHGPSLAFKDFGARFMARLMAWFLENDDKELHILVATSGDTGSAVAQGFFGTPGVKVTILYPSGKVSDVQEKQLTTLGNNITALEVEGTFDDCQRLVKEAFLDKELNHNINLTSANSINISRLIPQSFYYFYAWSRLKNSGLPVVFSVPSGNFGNLCGGLMAKRMGLPVHKFIASTNVNDVIPEFLEKGIFRSRPSVRTISNAMDVGNPSNYARLMDLYGMDIEKIREDITGKRYTDEETRKAMLSVYKQSGYVMDPHGAVGYLGLSEFIKEQQQDLAGAFLATAHPSKFPEVVEPCLNIKIDYPARLKEIISKKKVSVKIKSELSALKHQLL